MKVQEIMTPEVESCRPDSDLASVAKSMWDRDCGALPVVVDDGRVVGMITDRDVCIAVATKGRSADRISVREVTADTVHSCMPQDDLRTALETMKTWQVRRLPVIDDHGHLRGMLTLNDMVLATGRKRPGVPADIVLDAIRGVCEHRHAGVVAAMA